MQSGDRVVFWSLLRTAFISSLWTLQVNSKLFVQCIYMSCRWLQKVSTNLLVSFTFPYPMVCQSIFCEVIDNIASCFPNIPLVILGDFNYPNIVCLQCMSVLQLFLLWIQLVHGPGHRANQDYNEHHQHTRPCFELDSPSYCVDFMFPRISSYSLLHCFISAPIHAEMLINERQSEITAGQTLLLLIIICVLFLMGIYPGFWTSIETNWTSFQEKVASLKNACTPFRIVIPQPTLRRAFRQLSSRKICLFCSATHANCLKH